MFSYTTGNLLLSNAQALVNTVNCEGCMGKGIAYQFKLKYPDMNKEYEKQCRKNNIVIGKMFTYKDNDKYIINFPTKNKWRQKSKIEYISLGLDALLDEIILLNIKSIAIPPLGSGNGGLNWTVVKKIIEEKLWPIKDNVDIYIYEPSKNYVAHATSEPQLSLSALVLMMIKFELIEFNTTRLQKTAYFMNVYLQKDYFHFKRAQFGPYDNTIDIISKDIKAFQDYHKVPNTKEAFKILYNKLISKNTIDEIIKFQNAITKAAILTNSCKTVHDVECISTTLYIIQENQGIEFYQLIDSFKKWSEDKAYRFTEKEIESSINLLCKYGLIQNSILGYQIIKDT